MANWYGFARSNYFRVKDDEAFKKAMEPLDVEVSPGSDDHWEGEGPARRRVGVPNGTFCLLGRDSDSGGWPGSYYDEDRDDYVDVELVEYVAPHLADGEVAVFMEAGAEKLRYISGWAIAFNNKGEIRKVYLDDIYELAKDLGPNVTRAAY